MPQSAIAIAAILSAAPDEARVKALTVAMGAGIVSNTYIQRALVTLLESNNVQMHELALPQLVYLVTDRGSDIAAKALTAYIARTDGQNMKRYADTLRMMGIKPRSFRKLPTPVTSIEWGAI